MANQFVDENDPRLTQVENVARPAVRASAAGQPPAVVDPYQGGVVSSIGLQTDTANSQLPGVSLPEYRLMPVATALQPLQAAAQQSSAAQVAANTGGTPPTLRVPKEFIPTNQTGFLLQLAWALEETGTVFGVPPQAGGGRYDVSQADPGDSSTPISMTLTPQVANEFAFFYVATIGSGPSQPIPSGSWTQNTFDPPYGGDTTVYTQAGINSPVTMSSGSGATAHVAIGTLFFTDGTVPALLQTPVVSTTSPSPTVNLNITNHSNAAQIVTVSIVNSLSKATNVSVQDSNNNEYVLVKAGDDGITGGTAAWLFIATGVVGGSNTVTVTVVGGDTSGSLEISLMEYSGIIEFKTTPRFLHLVGQMIPPIDLSLVDENGGITNILGVGNGGTGLSSPGTNGNVLTSTGTAWTSSPPVGFANPMTTLGDLIDGGVGGTPQRVGIGSDGQVLTVSGGVPTWQNASGGVGAAIKINGVGTATDKQMYINGVADGATVWGVNINGTPDGG